MKIISALKWFDRNFYTIVIIPFYGLIVLLCNFLAFYQGLKLQFHDAAITLFAAFSAGTIGMVSWVFFMGLARWNLLRIWQAVIGKRKET